MNHTETPMDFMMSLPQLFESAFQDSADKEMIYDGTRRLSYREIGQEGAELAAGLQQLGIRKGDRVAVCLPTWYEYYPLLYAITKIGAIVVPINTRYRIDELTYILSHSEPVAAFTSQEADGVNQLSMFLQLKEQLPKPLTLISVRFEHEQAISYEKLREMGRHSAIREVPIDPKEDVAVFLYTSGTTGKPKAVMHTHRTMVARALTLARPVLENEVHLHTGTPYNHVMGLSGIMFVLGTRAKAVLMETYKAEQALQWTEQEKVTTRSGVPTHFILEMNHPNFKKYDMSSVFSVTMAAMNIPPEVVRKVKAEYGAHVQTAYGMTEIHGLGTMTRVDDDEVTQAETVGRAEPNVEVKVVNDQREEVPFGVIGEIAFRSIGMMKGYYNAPEQTKEVLDDDGWYYTGDLGSMDEKGYVRIAGRKKDLIIRGGYNIYPAEVENLFHTHPAVQEVAVVGLPDTVLGEVSCAAVLLKPGATAAAEDLKQFVREHLADYKVPDHIIFVDEYPKTSSGKVQKFLLRERIVSEKLCPLR